jgi:tRNA-(ms[2]io[6]A)-hydroxylase
MICGALIEARSCERFAALGPAIGGPAGELFHGLHAAEARHFEMYLELARRAAQRSGIDAAPRIDAFAALEAELISGRDEVFRFHSGVPS